MAYTPTVWETGDIITAEKLNKAEEGIAAASVGELPIVYIDFTQAADAKVYFTEAEQAILDANYALHQMNFIYKAKTFYYQTDSADVYLLPIQIGEATDGKPRFGFQNPQSMHVSASLETSITKDSTGWYGSQYID